MKYPNLLKAINSANILANLLFLITVSSVDPYGALAVAALGFPIVIILAVVSLGLNINFKSQNKIVGALDIALAVVSVIISAMWLVGFIYFASNIGF